MAGVAYRARKVQFGQESTWGTAVTATARLMAVRNATIKPVSTIVHPPELGRFGPSATAMLTEQHAEGMVDILATYEDLLYLLHPTFGSVSPTGAGPYVWTYSAPNASQATPKPATIEWGASGAEYKMAGAIGTKLKISCEAGDAWYATLDVVGKSLTTVSLASLSDRTVEGIRAADTVLSVDAVGGTMGTTAVASTGISFELEIDTKNHVKQFLGSVSPTDHGQDGWDVTLKTTLEYNTSAKAYLDALIGPALVQRQIELKATSGTKIARLQFAGYLQGDPELVGERNGNMIVDYTWRGQYNSTFGNYLKVILTNSVATLA